MLSQQENEQLTRVGPGTPMGELMRRYWHPIAATAELDDKPTKEVTLLGEELVLYKSPNGQLGLIGRYCPHRRASLVYGIPEDDGGLRCMYHGWKFDCTGRCTEQPFEETVNPEARFKNKVSLPGYHVQELGGLIFAYLGPEPVPLLPRWGPLVWDNCVRDIAITILPCNWLQCQENSLDPVHVEWLHAYYGRWVEQQKQRRNGLAASNGSQDGQAAGALPLPTMKHKKIGFDEFKYGIIKRRVLEGFTEDDDDWRIGHPILFPNILLVGSAVQATLQFRVPMDDTHTFHVSYYVYRAAPGATAPEQKVVPYRYVPLYNERGELIVDLTFNQDYMAWITQGPIARRELERLGESDVGIIMFRRLLKKQLDIVLDGGEPMNVFRDPAENECIEPPLEHIKFGQQRTLQYRPAEAGESQAVDAINAVLATWGPYLAKEKTPAAMEH